MSGWKNSRLAKFAKMLLLGAARIYLLLAVLLGCQSVQRKLLYHPSHEPLKDGGVLRSWEQDGKNIGLLRQHARPQQIWLFMHGNAGQAADRAYALPKFPPDHQVFILEYPGYGQREGSPGMQQFNQAALQAFDALERNYPGSSIALAGESIGSGPACYVASQRPQVKHMVLFVPFYDLCEVASAHVPFLPVRWMLYDRWHNGKALANYRGSLQIYGAVDDEVIPFSQAQKLAAAVPGAKLYPLPGGHNDWSLAPFMLQLPQACR